ncbi:MAG: cellulose binding domain-containing protein, partial [Ktedonobacteraceae bacterium]|nr:cellulose binding domain-containing protein [Ktedonobacteraceae bacterium]
VKVTNIQVFDGSSAVWGSAPVQAPTVSITSPTNGTNFSPAPATVPITASASASSGTIAKVEFYNGTTLLGTDTSSPYSFSWSNVAAGSYTLTAKAYDNNNVSATSAAVNITVGTPPPPPPTVSITSPANGATFTPPASITIAASASTSSGTISKVEFYNGATLLGTDTSSPYSFAWSNVAAGSYTLTAKAYDSNNGSATSSAVNITVAAASSCQVKYSVQNQWPGGFTTNITITNTGTNAINGWTLVFSFPNGQTITQIWGAAYTQQGAQVTAKDLGYNASIPPGASTTFGFNGSWNNTSNGSPTSFTLNGTTCSISP